MTNYVVKIFIYLFIASSFIDIKLYYIALHYITLHYIIMIILDFILLKTCNGILQFPSFDWSTGNGI